MNTRTFRTRTDVYARPNSEYKQALSHYVQLLSYHHPGQLTSCLRTACLVDWCWMQTFTFTKSNKDLCGTSIHHQTLSPAVAAALCVTWACQHAHRLHFTDILGIYTFRIEIWKKCNPQADVCILPVLLVFNVMFTERKKLDHSRLEITNLHDDILIVFGEGHDICRYHNLTFRLLSTLLTPVKLKSWAETAKPVLQEFHDKHRSSRSRSIDLSIG